MFQITGTPSVNQGFGGFIFKPWSQRSRSADQLQKLLQDQWNTSPARGSLRFSSRRCQAHKACRCSSSSRPPSPSRISMRSRTRYSRRQVERHVLVRRLRFEAREPQANLSIDRDLVAHLGLTQQDVGASLGAALGGGYVNYFSFAGRSYKVIPQVLQKDRLNPAKCSITTCTPAMAR